MAAPSEHICSASSKRLKYPYRSTLGRRHRYGTFVEEVCFVKSVRPAQPSASVAQSAQQIAP